MLLAQYWITMNMQAVLMHRSKISYPDGAIREMVVWRLPQASKGCHHRIKYRFYYGLADGTCLLRYDNEFGKGDHRHIKDREEPYTFVSVSKLVADFFADIKQLRKNIE